MNTTLTLMDRAGAIALLIWGVHMVQTGITRGCGPQLLDRQRCARRHRSSAFVGNPGLHDQSRACRRYRREESDAAGRQAHKAWRQLLGSRPRGDPRDDRTADQQRAGRRCRVHDRGPASCSARRKSFASSNCVPPTSISAGRAPAGPRASTPASCVSTSCSI